MKKKLMIFILAIFAVLLAACGSDSAKDSSATESTEPKEATEEATEITVNHLLGETVVPVNPKNVVVFDFGVLDTLDTLGVEVTALPKEGTVPSYLEKYKGDEYQSVGSLKEPDFEKINEIQPDLIIISSRQQDLYEEFQEIAPTIYMGVDTTKYMESFVENSTTLGKIFDKEAEVEAKLAEIDASIKALNEKAAGMDENALVVLAEEGNLSAYGPASRFGIIHDVFGVKPVDENIEVSTHGQSVSFEYVVEKDPNYLFVIDRGAVVATAEGGTSAKQILENDLIKGTKAYKEDRIVYLDPNYWYLSGGGLVSVAEMVKNIEAGLE